MSKARDLSDNALGTKPKVVDAKGDLVVGTGADAAARLAAASTAGYILTTDSGETTGLKWAAPAASGMTLLSTTSLSGASTTISAINTSYKNLHIYVKDFYSSSTFDLNVQLNENTTANNYMQFVHRAVAASSDGTYVDNGTAGFTINGYTSGTTSVDNFSFLVLPDYANATTVKVLTSFSATTTNAGGKSVCITQGGFFGSIAAITSITFVATAGTFSAGSVEIYGVN
jgi:hypothetical protein